MVDKNEVLNNILSEIKLLRQQQENAAADMSRELREIKVRLMDAQR